MEMNKSRRKFIVTTAGFAATTLFTVLELLRGIARTDGVGIVCSLHQVHFARAYADRIIGLSHGRIVIDGPSSEFGQAALERLYGHCESAEPESVEPTT